ncbi:MAG: hypothetical protein WDO13_00640 [Verrucomicrobiota bacterium]
MNDTFGTRSWVALFFALFAAKAALGQDTPGPVEKAPPPSPPYLNSAPENSAWTISFEIANGKPAPKDIKEIDVTKSGDARHEISIANDGTTSEAWFFKGVKLIFDKNAGYAVASDRYQNAVKPPSQAELDFLDFIDAAASNFAGRTTMAGHICYYYRPRSEYGVYELWIDMKTGLPVAERNDFRGVPLTQVYKFTSGGEAARTLPPAYLAAYQLHEKQADRARLIQAVLTR